MISALLLVTALSPELAATLHRAAEADLRLRETSSCDETDLRLVRDALDALNALESAAPPSPSRWRFPVERVTPKTSIGGRNGSGYVLPRRLRCYAGLQHGHPAHDLFVPDLDQDARDAEGRPWLVRAVEDSVVIVAHTGWEPSNPLKGGNFALLYMPARRQLAYYAHLETLTAAVGDRVPRGAPIGTLGRTGRNAWLRRSPTHLHFSLLDAKTLRYVDPYRELAAAEP